MQHRFRFMGSFDNSKKLWRIEGDEFVHLRKVLRLNVGAEVEVFNPNGEWGEGILLELESKQAFVEILKIQKEEIPQTRLGLAFGSLQQQTMGDLLPCLVELGIDEIHVFLQEGTSKQRMNEKTSERWNKIILSAMKQCKRALFPKIKTWTSLSECLEYTSKTFTSLRFLDPYADENLSSYTLKSGMSTCLFLGSEKGFSKEELAELQKTKILSVRLGHSILRSFTAAIAGASVLVSKRDSL